MLGLRCEAIENLLSLAPCQLGGTRAHSRNAPAQHFARIDNGIGRPYFGGKGPRAHDSTIAATAGGSGHRVGSVTRRPLSKATEGQEGLGNFTPSRPNAKRYAHHRGHKAIGKEEISMARPQGYEDEPEKLS